MALGQSALLRKRATLPETGVTCLAPLGEHAAAIGSADGVHVVSWDGSPTFFAPGFDATCLISLGTQTLAGGDGSGHIRIWHWRRRALKQVHNIQLHDTAISGIANGGDVMLTAAGDGKVMELNVLENFASRDFLELDADVLCVAFVGTRAALVGCRDGRVLEVSRRTSQVLQTLSLDASVESVDAEGDRILAAGGGCVAVWTRHGKGRDVKTERAGRWRCVGVVTAVLVAGGGVEDFVSASPSGLRHGGDSLPAADDPAVVLPVTALARGGGRAGSVLAFQCPLPRGEHPRQAAAAVKEANHGPRLVELELPSPEEMAAAAAQRGTHIQAAADCSVGQQHKPEKSGVDARDEEDIAPLDLECAAAGSGALAARRLSGRMVSSLSAQGLPPLSRTVHGSAQGASAADIAGSSGAAHSPRAANWAPRRKTTRTTLANTTTHLDPTEASRQRALETLKGIPS